MLRSWLRAAPLAAALAVAFLLTRTGSLGRADLVKAGGLYTLAFAARISAAMREKD